MFLALEYLFPPDFFFKELIFSTCCVRTDDLAIFQEIVNFSRLTLLPVQAPGMVPGGVETLVITYWVLRQFHKGGIQAEC